VRLGGLLLERGRGEAATRLLEPAASRLPDELQVRYLLAKAHLLDGSVELARRCMNESQPPMIPHAPAFALLGRMLSELGRDAEAESEWFRALSLNPWDPEVACEGLDAPALPSNQDRWWLCRDARRYPRY